MKVSKVTGYLLLGMILAAGILFFVGIDALAEDVTITTYYPAPYGVYVRSEINYTAPYLVFRETDQTLPAGMWRMGLDENDFLIDENTDATGDFSTYLRHFVIQTGGNVGIGTTSPQSELHVVETANGYVNGIRIEATDGDKMTIHVDTNATTYFTTPSDAHAQLTNAGAWQDASDIAIKKDIMPLSYGLDTVMEMQPRSYKMKSDDLPQIGFIAQELEQIIPEVVSGEEGAKGTSYGHLAAVTVKAIQEQQQEIEQLKARLAALEAKL